MAATVYVVPGAVGRVPYPRSRQLLPPTGAHVPLQTRDYYWERRLRDGDVVRVESPQQKEAGLKKMETALEAEIKKDNA